MTPHLLPAHPETSLPITEILNFLTESGLTRTGESDPLPVPAFDLEPRSADHYELTKLGKATRPLRLPKKAPACFKSQKEWELYRADAIYSAGDGFTFCTDCNQPWKDQMVTQGRCKYPLTQFVKTPSGVVVGRRKT